MNFKKKWVSLPLAISFLIVAVTGIILEFFFKSHELMEIHVWIGFLMVALAVFHLVKNIKIFNEYLKEKKIVLSFVLFFSLLSALFYYPTRDVEKKGKINPKVMTRVIENAKLEAVSSIFNVSTEEMLGKLQSKGVIASKDETLIEIAKKNHVEVEEVLGEFLGRK